MKPFRSRWDKEDDSKKRVIYREWRDGQWQFFIREDTGNRYVDRGWAEDQVGRGKATFHSLQF